jgi:hypothetical protein
MSKVTLDSALRGKLPDLSQPFAVCDEAGNIIGRLIPKSLEPPLPREEIERRKQGKDKTYTTAEVLAHLERL